MRKFRPRVEALLGDGNLQVTPASILQIEKKSLHIMLVPSHQVTPSIEVFLPNEALRPREQKDRLFPLHPDLFPGPQNL